MPSTSPEEDRSHRNIEEDGVDTQDHAPADTDFEAARPHGIIDEPSDDEVNARTAILHNIGASNHGEGEDGTFSTRPRYGHGYGSFASSYAGSFEQNRPSLGGRVPTGINTSRSGLLDYVPDSVTDGLLGRPKKRSTTHWLAERAGIKHERVMYVELCL